MLGSKKIYDICIIGAGASGLSAAIAAKRSRPEASVILVEEKDRVGQKILVTGNGRCNLSNRNMDVSHYGGEADRFSWLIESKEAEEEYFSSLSLLTYEDQAGRQYPYSNQASSVLNALLRKIESLDIETACNCKMTSIKKEDDGYCVVYEQGYLKARSVIIAVGSPAGKYKFDIQPLLKSSGDKVMPFRPALVPVYVSQDVRQMKGVRIKANVRLSLNNISIAEERGEIQVGDGYLSGICIMNLSRFINSEKGYELHVDIAPDFSDTEIDNYLSGIISENIHLSELLSGLVPKRVGEELLRSCCDGIFKRTSDTLTEEERNTIKNRIHDWVFSVRSLGPVNMAQIAVGGVCGLNSKTLESAVNEGLFYCGEVVNIDGECGGYNLHWAWVSGIQAGKSAIEYLNTKQGTDS